MGTVCDQTYLASLWCCEGLASSWVPYLGSADVTRLLLASRSWLEVVGSSTLWEEVAETWAYTKFIYGGCLSRSRVPWRRICALQERLVNAWRGTPASMRLDLKPELRGQKLADLEVMMVDFLAGDEGLVLGHARGGLSIWEICSPSQKLQVAPAWEAGASASAPCTAKVLGFFQASKRHDVQDIAVSPPAASQPVALLLGHSVWLAAAVGPTAYIWESSGEIQAQRPVTALTSWTLRGMLRHDNLFPMPHHAVWSVRLCGSGCMDGSKPQLAVTVGEDGFLRTWQFNEPGSANSVPGGTLLWQCHVGDARQVIAAIIAHPPSGMDTSQESEQHGDQREFLVSVARADQRSLQLFEAKSGQVTETISNVWPNVGGSLPQAAVYDTCRQLVLFSSITETGDGALARVDLSHQTPPHQVLDPPASPAAMRLPQAEGEEEPIAFPSPSALHHLSAFPSPNVPPLFSPSNAFDVFASPSSSLMDLSASSPRGSVRTERVSQVIGPLAGSGRVLRNILAVPAAGVHVAIVHEGQSMDVLEVWESWEALSNGPGQACFRTKLPPFLGNPRLIAVGGRRLVLLDPKTFMTQGELKVLEWRSQRLQHPASASCGVRQGSQGSDAYWACCPCVQGVQKLLSGCIPRPNS